MEIFPSNKIKEESDCLAVFSTWPMTPIRNSRGEISNQYNKKMTLRMSPSVLRGHLCQMLVETPIKIRNPFMSTRLVYFKL